VQAFPLGNLFHISRFDFRRCGQDRQAPCELGRQRLRRIGDIRIFRPRHSDLHQEKRHCGILLAGVDMSNII